jgi:hypothetical protein
MNTREHYWKNIFRKQQNSGLTQKEFCIQEKIKLSTFQYWRQRLASSGSMSAGQIVEIHDPQPTTGHQETKPVNKHLEIRWSKNSGFRFQMRWG